MSVEVGINKKAKFITEEFLTEISKVEEAADGSVYIEGVFLKGDVISKNNRFYSEGIVKNFVEQINSNKNIITMWTNHWPSDETLSTVARVLEARYDTETKLAWFKAKMARTAAAKDITTLLEDKMLEGVSVRYWPIKWKEAKLKDAIYTYIIEAEFFGIDFVATRTGIPVAKVKSVSREELELLETAFNREEEVEMEDLEKALKENIEDIVDTSKDTEVEDTSSNDIDVSDNVKPEVENVEVPEEKVEEDGHKIEDTKDKIEDIVDTKVKEEVEEIEDKPKEYIIDWKGMYESLLENVNKYTKEIATKILAEAINKFDPWKDKKIYSKIVADIEAVTFELGEDIGAGVNAFAAEVNKVVESYNELLSEFGEATITTTAKEAILNKGDVVDGKKLDVKNPIKEEAVNLFEEYGILLTDDDVKYMGGN